MQESKISAPAIDLNEIRYTVETCWCEEPHTHLCRPFSIQGRKHCLCDFLKKQQQNFIAGSNSDILFRHSQTDFFQTWYDDKDHYALHFSISLDDFDLYLRS